MRRLALILAALFCAGVAFADAPADAAKVLSVHTFTFKYKDAEKAAAIITPMISSEGSVSIQPAES